MTKEITAPHKDFESIKKNDENDIEYWTGRELMPLLGYKKWEKAEDVINRVAMACHNSGQDVDNHFHQTGKMVEIGSNTVRKIKDWKLDRYACYLIAQNGDSHKKEIAMAQTYFAIQTRKQEIFEQLPDTAKRIMIRKEVADHNKKLFKTAKQAGVARFGLFNDAGCRGLYGMPLSNVEQKKRIKKGELLDRSGSTELAANLFRITQTENPSRDAAKALAGEIAVLHEKLPKTHDTEDIMEQIQQLQEDDKTDETNALMQEVEQSGTSQGSFYAYLNNKLNN